VTFDELFDSFTDTAFRLETLQQYLVDQERERIAAFRAGKPLPERSPRTSQWLRRIQNTTHGGKRWRRVHVVDRPLSEYLQYQFVGYRGSVAAGEDVRIVDRAASSDLESLRRDFWLFDAETDHPMVVMMRYDGDGRFLGWDSTTSHDVIQACQSQRDLALAHSVSLEEAEAMLVA
jgi:hypothetical protein